MSRTKLIGELRSLADSKGDTAFAEFARRVAVDAIAALSEQAEPSSAHDPAISAIATLNDLGYQHCGGIRWKPPLGTPEPAKQAEPEPLASVHPVCPIAWIAAGVMDDIAHSQKDSVPAILTTTMCAANTEPLYRHATLLELTAAHAAELKVKDAEISVEKSLVAFYKAMKSADTRSEADISQLITERDNAEDWADKLATAISEASHQDIGEHSNLNNPWEAALEAVGELDRHHNSAVEIARTQANADGRREALQAVPVEALEQFATWIETGASNRHNRSPQHHALRALIESARAAQEAK